MNADRSLPAAFLSRLLLGLLLALAGLSAWAQVDPPARVAVLSHLEGSVAFAPAGEDEWGEAVRNRPITRGDRLWTDQGARTELQAGIATLHLDERSLLEVLALDQQVLQASLGQGSLHARLRQLQAGDTFEIDTPQVAFRAAQPGEWRIDVDADRGFTRVTVHSGVARVYGASGVAIELQPGEQMAFAGRNLAQVTGIPAPLRDDFDRWVEDRNRIEDASASGRYIPRDVVGYPVLDAYGTWSRDAVYGTVWYPRITVVDWAPYRYGHWEWIEPWGWTWIDDAPWGFAPFHYGRWALIGSRWAWVPGPIGPRPVYAPALVAFVGGAGWSLSISSGPGIGWYPLGPGEAWQPFFRASPVYVREVNRYVVGARAGEPDRAHLFQRRPEAITAVRIDDFHRARPVRDRWVRVNPPAVTAAQPVPPPAPLPEARRWAERARTQPLRVQPPPARAIAAPLITAPLPPAARGRPGGRDQEPREEQRRQRELRIQDSREQDHVQREQQMRIERAQREQVEQQRREQQQREEGIRREQQQREQAARRQQQEQERAVRELQQQRERAAREPSATPPREPPAEMRAPEVRRAPAARERREPAPDVRPPAAQPPQPQGEPRGRGEPQSRRGEEMPGRGRQGGDDEQAGRGRGRGNRGD